MTKKPLALGLRALLVGAGSLVSGAAPSSARSDISLTATAPAVSQYMFRGKRLGGPSFQPAVELHSGDLSLGLWSNFPLDGKVPDQSDPEIDFYASYGFEIRKDMLSLAPGFTFYTYPKAPTDAGYFRSTFEPSVALSYIISDFKVTATCYYDFARRGPTYELNAGYALPLANLGTELDFTATAGTYNLKDAANDTTPSVKSWGDYWLVGIAMPFQIASNQRLTVGFAYTEGTNAFTKAGSFPRAPNRLAVGRGVATISYAWSF